MDFKEALVITLTSDPDKEIREALDLLAVDEKQAREKYPQYSENFDAIIEEEKQKGFR